MIVRTADVTARSPLREQRVAFRRLKGQLYSWIDRQEPLWGFELAEDEGRIITPRLVRLASGQRVMAHDAVHKSAGQHPKGLATDLLLYHDVDGDGDLDYVVSGDHPIWYLIAARWESLHPLCVSGARWEDVNHIGFAEGSKGEPLDQFFATATIAGARRLRGAIEEA